jgi:hypothetical protein
LADLTLRESVIVTLLSAPLGFVITIVGAVVKGYAHISEPRELAVLGLVGAVMIPAITVVSFGIARLWRWLWRDFPS